MPMILLTLQLLQAVTAPVVPTASACQVVNASPDGSAPYLFAVCGKVGAPIGPADQYNVSVNPGGSVLAVVKVGGRTRVWLASAGAGGGVLLEEMTRELAHAAGRAGDLGLGGMAVDASLFATTGAVSVQTSSGTVQLDVLHHLLGAVTASLTAIK